MAKAAPLPEFVYEDQFEDHDWRALASTPAHERSKKQEAQVVPGPKLHPFSSTAVRVQEPGSGSDGNPPRFMWFPNADARDRWLNVNHPADQRATPSPTEAGPEQSRAAATGRASSEKVQGVAGKGRTTGM